MGYLFDPADLPEISKESLPLPMDEKIDFLHRRLKEKYGKAIVDRPEWVMNIAGGAMGQFCLFHASLTEYVFVFGTPIGTEGFSGRFLATDYFTILEGEQWAFSEGQVERDVYRPGDQHVLPWGQAKGYRMPDRCYALEYARGFIPAMLPFGLADTMTSTLDVPTLAKTFRVYTKAVVGNLLRGKL